MAVLGTVEAKSSVQTSEKPRPDHPNFTKKYFLDFEFLGKFNSKSASVDSRAIKMTVWNVGYGMFSRVLTSSQTPLSLSPLGWSRR